MTKLEELSKGEREKLICEFLNEMYFQRRKDIFKWAEITKQTPLIETKFLGQNLVSLVTGITGKGTAARGDDLKDGSEVKTCSRLDQLSKCNNCGTRVTALDEECPKCGSKDIEIMKDSHWIFTINTDNKYKNLTEKIPKIYFLLIDDTSLKKDEFARFTIWTIDPRNNTFFKDSYIKDYYEKNFLARRSKGENPAPMNVHPRSPKFKQTNPDLIFEATISNNGEVNIEKFLD